MGKYLNNLVETTLDTNLSKKALEIIDKLAVHKVSNNPILSSLCSDNLIEVSSSLKQIIELSHSNPKSLSDEIS